MILSNNINDVKQAGREWLRKKLAQDEALLPDYPRPLKTITEKGKSPFQKQVAQYGFAQAVYKNLAP